MTLYYFDRDVSGNKSACNGRCTEKSIPVAAPGNAEAQGDFTVITRNDGSKMWAFRYRPLYTSPADHAPGDANGYDPEKLWHIARPECGDRPIATCSRSISLTLSLADRVVFLLALLNFASFEGT